MAGRFSFFSRFTLFRGKVRVREDRSRRYTLTNPYHAVSIQIGYGACQEARDCAGKRFLSAEAPTLPLGGCDAASCRCRYVHHDDRREGPRRESDVMRRTNHFWGGNERRRSGGRRVTDL